MGRNTSGVKGITLSGDDEVIGMVVADPEATLLTACEKGYGKRTLFGPNSTDADADERNFRFDQQQQSLSSPTARR